MSNNSVDITITFANEYGQMAVQRIFGVEILNAGAGLSVDDIVSESQMTFVARSVLPMTPKEASSMMSSDGMVTWDQVNSMLKAQGLSPASTDNNLLQPTDANTEVMYV